MTLPRAPYVAAAALAGLVACAGSDSDEPAAAPAERLAVVALTWRADQSGLAQAYVIDYHPAAPGLFGTSPARGEAAQRQALGVLSLPAAVAVLDASLAVEQCRVERVPTSAGPIVLRDLGEVSVESQAGLHALASKWLSDDGALDLSGPAYAGVLAPSVGTASPLVVTAEGTTEVGAFAVGLTRPPAVRLQSIAGHPVDQGHVILDGDGSELRATDVSVTWDAADVRSSRTSDSRDLAWVVFERRGFGEVWQITCAANDDGAFVIPAAAISALPELGPDKTDKVLVRRIDAVSFSARGLPDGLALAVSEDQAYVD